MPKRKMQTYIILYTQHPADKNFEAKCSSQQQCTMYGLTGKQMKYIQFKKKIYIDHLIIADSQCPTIKLKFQDS